jgi:tetratricopeptide (TPR) repeat protein
MKGTIRRSVSGWAAGLLLALTGSGEASAQGAPDSESTFNAGLAHLREGRTELALEAFRKAIRQDGKNPYFYKGLGVAHSQLADKCPPADEKCRRAHQAEAVNAARKALELNPYFVDARTDLGIALLRTGRRDEGKRELLAAFEDQTNPFPELSARNLGQAYLEEKNYVQALSWFNTAAQRNRSYADAYLGAADALAAQGKPQDAIAQLELGLKALPDDLGLLLDLGQAYYRAGRFSEARARLEQVAAKDPAGAAGRRAAELLKNLR